VLFRSFLMMARLDALCRRRLAISRRIGVEPIEDSLKIPAKLFRREIQVIITVLSADRENDPDVLGVIGGSAVLAMSEIPYDGPVGATRVGYIDGQYIVNPTFSQLQKSQLDLVVASTRDAVMMVEAGAQGVPEDMVLGAIRFAHEANQEIIALEQEIITEHGKPKKPFTPNEPGAELRQAVSRFAEDRINEIIATLEKDERESAIGERRQELLERLGETYQPELLLAAFDQESSRARSPESEGRAPRDGLFE
jgi:polyribonucleotide nucleotidyltransferase